MKKLLTLFSAFVLGSGSVFGMVSCRPRIKEDNKNKLDINRDLDHMNDIKKEAKQHFNSWWEEHTSIDINAVRGQETSFNALVSILKEKKELTLLGEEVQEWRFLARLFTEFINEFNNFNHSLAIKYSNYYHTSKPLVLSENDSSFNLTNINFDNLAKFIPLSSKNVLALTVKFNIMYEVKFKELQVRDLISGLIVVSNDLVAVKHMQADLKDYFVTFIDILFAKQNYSMVDRHNSDFNDVANVPDAVWNIIRTELNRLNITFFSKVVPYGNLPSLYKLTDNISKQYASVLLWAGEGYKPDKLTWQNFLYFFQRVQFPNGLISEGKYYVKANIASLNSCDFMIENLPLQNDKSEIVLKKPFKILMEKEPVDRKLTQFSQLIMDFWHYYKLETFNDKLVFHMSQVNFNALKQTIDSFASERLEFSNIELIFSSIFDYFNKRRTATIIADTHFSIWLPELHTFNLVKKSNSIIIEWFRKKVENVENLQIKINFGYNNFGYSFVPRLSIKDNNIHTGEYLRLDTFEFKIE